MHKCIISHFDWKAIFAAAFVAFCFVITGCSHVGTADEKDAPPGKITQEELYKDYPSFARKARAFVPNPAAVDKIKTVNEKTEVIMFLGTWCPDCREQSPKLLKTLDATANPNFSVEIYFVDRAKKDWESMVDKYEVKFIPTMIFVRDGKELGRFVESPKKSIEQDILDILGLS